MLHCCELETLSSFLPMLSRASLSLFLSLVFFLHSDSFFFLTLLSLYFILSGAFLFFKSLGASTYRVSRQTPREDNRARFIFRETNIRLSLQFPFFILALKKIEKREFFFLAILIVLVPRSETKMTKSGPRAKPQAPFRGNDPKNIFYCFGIRY